MAEKKVARNIFGASTVLCLPPHFLWKSSVTSHIWMASVTESWVKWLASHEELLSYWVASATEHSIALPVLPSPIFYWKKKNHQITVIFFRTQKSLALLFCVYAEVDFFKKKEKNHKRFQCWKKPRQMFCCDAPRGVVVVPFHEKKGCMF